jgi:hypothetical protein
MKPGILSPQMDAESYPRSPMHATDQAADGWPKKANRSSGVRIQRKARKLSLVPSS